MNEDILKDYAQYIIIVETVIILLLLLWHFFFTNDHSETFRRLEGENKKLKQQLMLLKNDVRELSKENADLKQMEQNTQIHVRQEHKIIANEFIFPQEHEQKECSSQVLYRFLQEANEGKFLRLFENPEKCFFRTWEENGVRKFEFCGNVPKALANINAIFDDVCEIEGKRSGASEIENVSAGILDPELRIISKARIRLK